MSSLDKLGKPRENEKRSGESALKEIVESDDFYTKNTISQAGDIFYFHQYGDCLKGILISRQTRKGGYYPLVTYKMKVREMRQDGADVPVEVDQVVEFAGLKHLRRNIDKNELIGSLVRIIYIGREKTGFGHSAKVFDVFKDVGVTSRKEIYQDGSKRKYKKRAKTKTGRERGRNRDLAKV